MSVKKEGGKLEEPTLVDFEAGMDDEQAQEAMRRWKAYPMLYEACKALLAVAELPTGPAWDNSAYRFAKGVLERAEGRV